MVLLAARYPFPRVVGVDLSPDVAAIARQNVSTVRRHLRCSDVEIVVADLATYEIPDDVTLAFCFNPVTGDLFSRLLTNLNESLARRPRELRLIYHNPTMHSLRREAGWRELRRLEMQTNPDYRNDVAVYVPEPSPNTVRLYGGAALGAHNHRGSP